MGRAKRRGKSYAPWIAAGAALQGGVGFYKDYKQQEFQEKRLKSLEELRNRELNLSQKRLEIAEADSKALSDYRSGLMDNARNADLRQGYKDWLTNGKEMVKEVFGKDGMTATEQRVLATLMRDGTSIESAAAAEEMMAQMLSPAEMKDVSWDKVDKLYKGLQSSYRTFLQTDAAPSPDELQTLFPLLYGSPTEDPLFDPVQVAEDMRPGVDPGLMGMGEGPAPTDEPFGKGLSDSLRGMFDISKHPDYHRDNGGLMDPGEEFGFGRGIRQRPNTEANSDWWKQYPPETLAQLPRGSLPIEAQTFLQQQGL